MVFSRRFRLWKVGLGQGSPWRLPGTAAGDRDRTVLFDAGSREQVGVDQAFSPQLNIQRVPKRSSRLPK